MKYCLYLYILLVSDDTETANFDCTVLLAMLHDGGPRLSCGGKIHAGKYSYIAIYNWLKHCFCNTPK